MSRTSPHLLASALATVFLVAPASLRAQFAPEPPKPLPPPAVTWTQQRDHDDMMRQLGITAMRPGPSGNEMDPNHANYDEAKANPYPNLPDPLRLPSGERVTQPMQWWGARRPQIVEDLEREMYGRVPKDAPKVTWSVKVTDHEFYARHPVIARRLVGHVDNSGYPLIDVDIDAVLVLPADARGPVPVLIMFGRPQLPAPAQPNPANLDKLNEALRAMLAHSDPSLAEILNRYPAYEPLTALPGASPFAPRPAAPAGPPSFLGSSNDPPATEQLISDGWGYLTLDPNTVQADDGSGLTRGVIGLVNHGRPRNPDDWGALRAWAWGASRALDYLESDPAVDAKHVGIEGVSRYGKAALVTEAFDQRFYMGLIGSSGEGGAKLSRRNFGEAVENLTTGEYHWMAGNFLRYGAAEPASVAHTPGDLPVDAHDLIALCAPRLVFLSYGIPEHGDAKWLDQQGSLMAGVAAQPVFALLGAKTLGLPDDYLHATMPPVLTGLLEGKLAWRQHDGGHTDAPNVRYFLAWADRWMDRPVTGVAP